MYVARIMIKQQTRLMNVELPDIAPLNQVVLWALRCK